MGPLVLCKSYTGGGIKSLSGGKTDVLKEFFRRVLYSLGIKP